MAKMVANKYYTKDGDAKVNSYFVSITREMAEKSGLVDKEIRVYQKGNKIIVESVDEEKV